MKVVFHPKRLIIMMVLVVVITDHGDDGGAGDGSWNGYGILMAQAINQLTSDILPQVPKGLIFGIISSLMENAIEKIAQK